MIQANELRIGNIVDVDDMKFTIPHGNWIDEHYDVCNGIPLTPEILEKCGFEIDDGKGYCSDEKGRIIYDCKNFYISHEDQKFYLWNHVEGDTYFSHSWPEIKYLHELQNLYFALTNTELEINL